MVAPLTRDLELFARGTVRHPDHATITLHGWHRVVVTNTEKPCQRDASRRVPRLSETDTYGGCSAADNTDCDSRNTGSNPVGRLGGWVPYAPGNGLGEGHRVRRVSRPGAREARLPRRRATEHGVSALLLALYHHRPDARDALIAAGAPIGPLEAAALGDVDRLRRRPTCPCAAATASRRCTWRRSSAAPSRSEILARGADPDVDANNTFGVRPIHSATAVWQRRVRRARCWRPGRTRTSPLQGGEPHAARQRRGATRTPRSSSCCSNTAPAAQPELPCRWSARGPGRAR